MTPITLALQGAGMHLYQTPLEIMQDGQPVAFISNRLEQAITVSVFSSHAGRDPILKQGVDAEAKSDPCATHQDGLLSVHISVSGFPGKRGESEYHTTCAHQHLDSRTPERSLASFPMFVFLRRSSL